MHVLDGAVRLLPVGNQEFGVPFGKPVDLAETQPERRSDIERILQHIIPVTEINIDGQHRHAMLAGIAHDLGGCVKPMGWELRSAAANTSGWWHLIHAEI